MQSEIIQSMHEQVRAIYRAVTGEDVAEDVEGEAAPEAAESTEESTDENITRRFAELEVMARALPSVTERIPPYTFTPPVDVVATDGAVLLELALPGIDRDDITVERRPEGIAISGIRRDSHAAKGSRVHAEIPRGPFFRTIPLPSPIESDPRVELDRGVLRIYLTLAATTRREGSAGRSESERNSQNGEQKNAQDGDQRRAAP